VVARARAVRDATRSSFTAVREATQGSFALAVRDGQWCLLHRAEDGYWVQRYPDGVTIDKRPLVGPTVRQLNERARDYFLQEYVPRAGDVVIDVGAGVGAEMYLFSGLVGDRGRLYAIEAHPGTYERLARVCRVNRRRNVETHLLAITDQPGEITISDTEKHIANTVMGGGGDGLRVPAETLDGFVEKHGIARIDFLKMNIEGAERLAIRGMQRSIGITQNVCICCHDFLADRGGAEDMRTKELVQRFLVEHGFDIVDRAPEDRRPWSRDYVYGRRRSAAGSAAQAPGSTERTAPNRPS
jgi:FkbM family methyltransferase